PPRGSAAPKPLFAGRKVSIAELRHKFSKDSSSTNKKVGNMEQPPLPTTLDKAGRVLGAHPNKNNGRTPPASAPASSNTPEPYRASTDNDYPSRHGSPQRQIRSTPVPGPPTLRFFNENPGSRPSPASQRTYETASNEYNTPISGADAMILGDGKLSPTKNGAYGRMGNVEMQQHPAREVQTIKTKLGLKITNLTKDSNGTANNTISLSSQRTYYLPPSTPPPSTTTIQAHGKLYSINIPPLSHLLALTLAPTTPPSLTFKSTLSPEIQAQPPQTPSPSSSAANRKR
ncbi:MAG: hypothetical protein M1830_007478, partial [Pleopsidium flavum]